jgi:hypothetical protein
MHTVRADQTANRLFITLEGTITEKDAEETVDLIFREVLKLRPGFDVITDLTKYKIGHLGATKSLGHAMEFLKVKGVRRVVWIVGRSKAALLQFARATIRSKGYKVMYVTSLEAAENKLKES